MTTALIILVLLVVVGVVVYFANRKKPGAADAAILPRETDTGWNDPMTPGRSAQTESPSKDARQDEPRA